MNIPSKSISTNLTNDSVAIHNAKITQVTKWLQNGPLVNPEESGKITLISDDENINSISYSEVLDGYITFNHPIFEVYRLTVNGIFISMHVDTTEHGTDQNPHKGEYILNSNYRNRVYFGENTIHVGDKLEIRYSYDGVNNSSTTDSVAQKIIDESTEGKFYYKIIIPCLIYGYPENNPTEYGSIGISEMVDLITEIFTSDTYGYKVCERDYDLAGNALSTMTLNWE